MVNFFKVTFSFHVETGKTRNPSLFVFEGEKNLLMVTTFKKFAESGNFFFRKTQKLDKA